MTAAEGCAPRASLKPENKFGIGVSMALGVAGLGLGISGATSGGGRPVDPAGVGAALATKQQELKNASDASNAALTGVQNLNTSVTNIDSQVQSQKTLTYFALGLGIIGFGLAIFSYLKKRGKA